MEQVLMTTISVSDLAELIRRAVKEAMPREESVKVSDPKGYKNIATYCNVSKSTIQKRIKAKKLPIYRMGKSIFLDVTKYEENKYRR